MSLVGKSLRGVIFEEWVGICQADQREKERRALGRGAGIEARRREPSNLPPVGWLGHGARSRNMKKGLEQQAEEHGFSHEGALEPGRV